MGQVLIPDLDDAVIASYRDRARANGRSLEAELREVLTSAVRPGREQLLKELDAIRARTRPPRPGEADATAMIREDRDSR